jgi:hypothetical protein
MERVCARNVHCDDTLAERETLPGEQNKNKRDYVFVLLFVLSHQLMWYIHFNTYWQSLTVSLENIHRLVDEWVIVYMFPDTDVRWMCRVHFNVVWTVTRDQTRWMTSRKYPTDEILQFYGCVLVYHSCLSPWNVSQKKCVSTLRMCFSTLIRIEVFFRCVTTVLVSLPGTEDEGPGCHKFFIIIIRDKTRDEGNT